MIVFYLNVHKAYFTTFSLPLVCQYCKTGSVLLILVPQSTQHSAWHMQEFNKCVQLIWYMCEIKNLSIQIYVETL